MISKLGQNAIEALKAALATRLTTGATTLKLIVYLFINDITPNATSIIGDFNRPSDSGLMPEKTLDDVSTAYQFRDPLSGELVTGVTLVQSLRWMKQDSDGIPTDVYGYVAFNSDNSGIVTWGRFPQPVTLSNPGDGVEIDEIEIRTPMSVITQ